MAEKQYNLFITFSYIFNFIFSVTLLLVNTDKGSFLLFSALNLGLALSIISFLYDIWLHKMSRDHITVSITIIALILFKFTIGDTFTFDRTILHLLLYYPIMSRLDRTFLRRLFFSKIIFFITIVVASRIGFIQEQIYSKVTMTGEVHSLGFINGNAAGVVIFSILLDSVILNIHRTKKTLVFSIGLFVVALMVYKVTYSRTAVLMSIIIAIIYLFKKLLLHNIVSGTKVAMIQVSIVVANLVLALNYNPDITWMSMFNEVVSGRLRLSHIYLSVYRLSWMPQIVTRYKYLRVWDSLDYYLDNYWISFFIENGLLYCTIFGIVMFLLLQGKRFNLYTLLLISVCYVYLSMESLGYNLFLFTPLLFSLMSSSSFEDKDLVISND
ncbi:hypothetical protein [Streptococcus sp. KHUD_018]